MTFKEDLADKVDALASENWGDIPDGYVVPAPADLTFGNTGRRLRACILYADISESTKMVDELPDFLAADYYKAFLHCAAKIIKRNGGEVTAYDGDRVMAVFLGASKEDSAVAAALEIGYAVQAIINPRFQAWFANAHRPLKHTVGIDTGQVLVSKTGVRVDSDLVWVGSAANYAAKLNSFIGIDHDYPIRITESVYAALSDPYMFAGPGVPIWDGPYNNFDPRLHYRSNYRRSFP